MFNIYGNNVKQKVSQVIVICILHFKSWNDKLFAFKSMGMLVPSLEKISGLKFVRLLGTGSGSGFGLFPEFGKYVFLSVWENESSAISFFKENEKWHNYHSRCHKSQTFYMSCCLVHGAWMGVQPFDQSREYDKNLPLAVITRATIKWSEMIRFWRDVPAVNRRLRSAFYPVFAVGIGEWPLRFQATFSIWKNGDEMEKFAFRDETHRAMIKKTKKVGWYKEELFARFHLLRWEGDNLTGYGQ
ncbi:MAG: hypothetical protein IPM42_14265 [Saprospiraceae bacterium]|nr:hypothetical protein [Saprospiraceae bacterium]